MTVLAVRVLATMVVAATVVAATVLVATVGAGGPLAMHAVLREGLLVAAAGQHLDSERIGEVVLGQP